jgi:hypothetical protein
MHVFIVFDLLAVYCCNGGGVARSVQCLTTDWITGVWSLAEAKDFSSSLCVSTSSEVYQASYTVSTGGQGVMLTTHPSLMLMSWMSRSCISSPPWCLHGRSRTALLVLVLTLYCKKNFVRTMYLRWLLWLAARRRATFHCYLFGVIHSYCERNISNTYFSCMVMNVQSSQWRIALFSPCQF